jgi:hypothetical protein
MKTLSTDDAGRLLEWLKGNALEMAHELREAGWEEDARGLWREGGKGMGCNLFDAHRAATKLDTQHERGHSPREG